MNPSNSSVDSGRQAGTAPVNLIDNPKFVNHQGLNTFDLSQQFLFTARYGECTPFFNMECVGRDRVRLRNSVDLRSYTLSSPLLSSLRMKKSYFQVPLSGILPNTWQYLFTNPLKGNDIPENAQCRFNLKSLIDLIKFRPSDIDTIDASSLMEYYIKCLCLCSCLFSAGGLLYLLGCKNKFGFDAWLERNLFHNVSDFSGKLSFSSPYDYFTIEVTDLPSFRTLFYSVMEYPDGVIHTTIPAASIKNLLTNLLTFLSNLSSLPTALNISKVVAYQFIWSQFYTNDKIDNIYNSELFLSNQKSLAKEVISPVQANPKWFYQLNGIDVEYDVYSYYFTDLLIKSAHLSGETSVLNKHLDFWLNTFSLRRSLRYGDYFTGARTQPLAVGDTSVLVSPDTNKVSVVDINKSIHIQRFLNACNRVGSNLINYTRGIFGYEPPKDYHQPSFIASETEFIGGQEVENTSDNKQGNVVTNLRSSSSKFEFDVFIDNPCYILGIVTFECTPAYSNTINRDFFHFDRFDYFNPMLQNIGDQPIMMSEYDSSALSDLVFGYQSRYAEYKHRYSECSGGFAYNLPSWGFIKSDPGRSISEYTIRSRPDEFDRFYKSLSYGCPAGYYHFILSIVNNVDSLRPMEVSPSLL